MKNITIHFVDDIDLVIQAIENGDYEDAIKLLEEIKEEQNDLLRGINKN
jgi:ribosomal protein L22